MKRALVRFTFLYLSLFLLRDLLAVVYLERPFLRLWDPLVIWAGKLWFQLEIDPTINGSSDRPYDYVNMLLCLLVAGVATALWTAFRKRSDDAKLQEWFMVFLCFLLATNLIGYGLGKVLPLQFPTVRLYRLVQTFGEVSPMGLLWTFMGASTGYQLFTGLVELLAGVLLIPRRTRLLGALVSLGTFTNILMLNLSYDVSVKLFSAHLLAASLLLAAPDLRRLANLFLLDREVEPAERRPLFATASANRWAAIVWTVFFVGYSVFALYNVYVLSRTPPRGSFAPKSPFYGIWNVEEMVVDGVVRPPLLTDGERWRRVIFDSPEYFTIQLMQRGKGHLLTLDTSKKTLALTDRQDPSLRSLLSYRQPSPEVMVLAGTYEGRRLQVRLRKRDMKELHLVSRGFHWVSERPFNR